MPWPKIGATNQDAKLGLTGKGRAIKGLVVWRTRNNAQRPNSVSRILEIIQVIPVWTCTCIKLNEYPWSRATMPKKQSSALEPSGPQSKVTFFSAPAWKNILVNLGRTGILDCRLKWCPKLYNFDILFVYSKTLCTFKFWLVDSKLVPSVQTFQPIVFYQQMMTGIFFLSYLGRGYHFLVHSLLP